MLIAIQLLAGIALLYYGAEWLVKGGVGIAARLGIPPLIIGLTLEKLPESGYLEAESKVVQVVRDEEDLWSIPQSDYDDLDGRIIDYNF